MANKTKVIYLTAGAAGMYCGSCMHDNALAKAMIELGWDIQLVPTYTPIRTDETDVSVDQVLFGGVNVFLQQKIPFFRYLPSIIDHFLDSPGLIRRVTANAMETDAKMLGSLTLSMLQGINGNQRKEVRRMCKWLKNEQPDVLIFSNMLIGGCIEYLKQQLQIPIIVTLQGDDVFLDGLPEPFRAKCMERLKKIVKSVDGFIVHTEFFKNYMAEYFEIDLQKIHVTPLGIDTTDFQSFLESRPDVEAPSDVADSEEARSDVASGSAAGGENNALKKDKRVIGYMARLAPEKGLQHLVDAFIELKKREGHDDVHLHVAGWLGPQNDLFAQSQWERLDAAGLKDFYVYLGAIDRAEKMKMLGEIDLLSVPTEFREPKGLYALEAMAAGVPVVKPAHGAFPELIQLSGGGLLFVPGNISDLVDALEKLLGDEAQRERLGEAGKKYVHASRNAKSMAVATGEVIERVMNRKKEEE